jgi:hypothetical protein
MYPVPAPNSTKATEDYMRISTVLATVSTLLLTLPIAKAQSPCVSGFTASVAPAQKRGSPFTATVKLTLDQKLADGNAIHGEVHYQIARDASGKTMSEMPMNCVQGDDGHMHQLFQVTVRFENTMENWTIGDDRMQKTANIVHFPDPVRPSEAELAAMRANAQSHPARTNEWQTEKLGTREFAGILANGTRRTQTIPAGEQGNALPLVTVNESWIASQLNLNMMAIFDDPRRGRTTAEIVEFHLGDPDYIVKAQPAAPPATIISTPTPTQ